MSENSRIYPSGEKVDTNQATSSLPDYHWKLCCQFMERYQNLFPEEQIYALSHIFANTQLLLRGDADQTMQLVLDLVKDQLPVNSEDVPTEEVDQVEKCCWEREAEPEFPEPSPVIEIEAMDISTPDVEVIVTVEPEQIVDISEDESLQPECPNPVILVDTEVPTLDSKLQSGPNVELHQTTPEEPKNTVPEPLIKTTPNWHSTQVPPKIAPTGEPITFQRFCKNLVLFDDNFYKSQTYYNRLGCGQLEVTLELGPDHCATHATIHANELILSEASAKNRSKAMKLVIDKFFRATKDHCFRVETLPYKNALLRTTNLVPRQTRASAHGDPLVSIDPGHYRKVMLDFMNRDNGYHLVFSKDFTNLECSVLQGIAAQLKINCRVYDLPDKSQRFLLLARELFPQEIVHRILLEHDTDLSLQYQVSLPNQKRTAVLDALNARALQTSLNSADEAVSSGAAYDPEILSPKEDPPVPSTLNPRLLGPNPKQFFMKKVKTQPESYVETVANLTVFKPVSPLRSVDDVYRNLVLIDADFRKTAQEFGELKLGPLLVCSKELDDGGFSAMVHVGKFVLVEICNPSSSTRKAVKLSVQAAFIKKAKMFCYQITKKQSPEAEIHVTKQEDPSTNIGHYKRLIKDFWTDSVEQDLLFGADFTKSDRIKFHSIAHALNLKSCSEGEDGVNRRLRIFGRRLPALAIVERIVVAKDPKLSALFEVIAPRVGSRQEGGL